MTTPCGDDLADPAPEDPVPHDELAAGTAHSPGIQEAPPAPEQATSGGRAEVPPLRDEKRG